ncbi:MAG: transcriptional regulator NrdR [Lachnospiraceae bacterium]|nr:transcriptional regulator NrdR [Lachnospiraceae bacterium]
MKCPFCNAEDTKVIDSRQADDGNSTRRRRECELCGKRFTTYEKYETTPTMIIKKDGTREFYDREKLLKGITFACHKLPVSVDKIDEIVNKVETTIINLDKEVSSERIGNLVMECLKDVHPVAYVRFASVYKEFKETESFNEAINALKV